MIQIQQHDTRGLPLLAEGSDEELIRNVLAGRMALYAVLMRRYNARLYRIARGITRNDGDAEDAVQQAFTAAYRGLAGFRGESAFATWLSRIAVREALRRVEQRKQQQRVVEDATRLRPASADSPAYGPEGLLQGAELLALLERLVDALPNDYRTVFMMRDVQEMSTRETADALCITEEAARVRLHRARLMLRQELQASLDMPASELFGFDGPRCDRIVLCVWRRLEVSTHEIKLSAQH